MKTAYTFKCLKCGKRFRTTNSLHMHNKYVHKKEAEIKKHISHKKKEIHTLERKLPRKRTNWLAIIIFLILIALFIYFVYFRG